MGRHRGDGILPLVIPATVIMPTSRRRKNIRILGLLLALGLGAWLARDLPRRAVEAALAEQLAALVHLEKLEIEDRGSFRLKGLKIEKLRDYPFVDVLRIEEVLIESTLRDVLENRFARLVLRGVEARLAPAPRVEPPEEPLPVIGELILEPAVVRIATEPGEPDLELAAEARIHGIGTGAHGEVRLSSPDLTLAPFFRLVDPSATPTLEGHLADFEAVLRLGDRPRLRGQSPRPVGMGQEVEPKAPVLGAVAPVEPELSVRLSRASLTFGGGSVALDEPRLHALVQEASIALELDAARVEPAPGLAPLDGLRIEATISPLEDGVLRIELRPDFAWFEDATLEADWEVAGQRLLRIEGSFRGLDLARLLPGSGVDATADADFHSAGERLHYSADLAPRRLALAADRFLSAGEGSTVHVQGSLPFARLRGLQLPAWSGPVEARIRLPSGQGRWDDRQVPAALFPVTASFEGRLHQADIVRFRGAARFDSAAGSLAADGEIAFADAANQLSWNWSGGELDRLVDLLRRAGLPAPAFAPSGGVEGSGTLGGRWTEPVLAGRLRLAGVEAADAATGDPAWILRRGEATATWEWSFGEPIRLRSLKAEGRLALPPLEPLDVALSAEGRSTADFSRGELSNVVLEASELGRARISGSWHPGAPGKTEASGTLALEQLGLSRWQEFLQPLLGAAMPADLTFGGTAEADLEIAVDGDRSWHLAGPLSLDAAGFSSDDGSRVMEGLRGRWQLAAHGTGSAIEAEAEGTAGGFVLLWNTFFGDFSQIEAALSASGSQGPASSGTRPWRIEARGSLPAGPMVEARLESSPESDAWRYALKIDDDDLAATHQRYLSGLVAERLGGLDLGGRLSATAGGSYRPGGGGDPASWSLTGRVKLERFELTSGGGQAAVAGLELDLPLDLRRRPTPELAFTGPRLAGRLAFERLAVRGLELPPTDTDLLIEADAVGLEKPIALEILGGSLTFEQLSLRHLLRPGRHLETGIRLTGLRLAEIARTLELFPLEGSLNGYLPRVALSPDRLRVEGGGEFEVFGGTVRVRDISGENVLTRFPKITLSADFQDIDLGRLTRRIDFGEMTGTLQGSLEDCELFRGVPVRFSARLETVERKGVPRTVDVKAINNITILGTGQGTNIFDRGLQRFFQQYTYSALGVTMRLDNDRLLLRGLERSGGKELFLRGRFPFRIDVVNAQPGKTVSFQAMVHRLKSLDFGSAETER